VARRDELGLHARRQRVAAEIADPAELGELERTGMATMLIVPVVLGGRTLAVLELYRAVPMAFTTREIDRARVMAHQFAAALDRLIA
jgi:GAF domain-containing protein